MSFLNSVQDRVRNAVGGHDAYERVKDLAITGLPAVGLLGLTGDNTGEKVGGTVGGLAGLGAEIAGLNYLDSAGGKALDPRKRLGLQLLTGIAPIASEMIGSGIGGMINPAHR